ncbi:MAG TPA: ATP-dependent helicase [Treponema sp.]|nr:ATP-dependent helicase [Treponema sp.]HBB42871.1 ATP-dependent helicase [Treponema sp.]HCA19060.1 ATP-dependent helicase [Treponema sp.]
MNDSFSDIGLSREIVSRLEENGITEPTPVQKKVIPLVAEGKNILFQSETGTGKTFAYLLPLVEALEKQENPRRDVRLLIVSPTYELASQIKQQVQKISSLKCALCIGGSPLSKQVEKLREHPEIVIGGPARLLELIHLKKMRADSVKTLVLDEADRLMSPELRDDTKGLLDRLPRSVQLIGNSATVSDYTRKILQEARDGLEGAREDTSQGSGNAIILVTLPPEDILRKKITHWALFAERRDKIDTLRSFINAVKPEKLIVFTSRSDQVDNIVGKMRYKKLECDGFSAKSDKRSRKEAIDKFRSGKIPILVTTDLASRGLDIAGISHVVQMDLPEKADFFVHRAGRTARAGQTGINCVIGDEREMEAYARLEKKLKITVYPKVLYGGKLLAPEDAYGEETEK